MAKINISKIASKVVSEMSDERKIIEYKEFYKEQLFAIKNKESVLHHLKLLCSEFFGYKFKTVYIQDPQMINLRLKAQNFLRENFSSEVLAIYDKKLPLQHNKPNYTNDKPMWAQIFLEILNIPKQIDDHYKQDWEYKTAFLFFLYNCIYSTGLNPLIEKRDIEVYKRFNFLLEHDFKSKSKLIEHRSFLSPEKLKADLLIPYEKQVPILINGKLIPHKNIHRLTITSTLLLDDEIELFALKNHFTWNKVIKDEISFIRLCANETETQLKNPFLLETSKYFRNNSIYFVSPERITELSKICSKQHDLIKLTELCKELNNVSAGLNFFSASFLIRAIIDHVPPIFGFSTFAEVANNYSSGTKSFKKSMGNLNTSLRNIADNNIHSQIRNKEVIPTLAQSDFSPDLDLLLSEVIRILK
jgi:hypothetical protein